MITNIPNALIASFGRLNLKGFTLLCLQGPSQGALVFDGFNVTPDTSPKVFNTVTALFNTVTALLTDFNHCREE